MRLNSPKTARILTLKRLPTSFTVRCNPNLFRVLPGDSGRSFVYNKISVPAPLCGQRMPLEGAPLEPAEQQIIKDWIDQGAEHN